MFCDVRSEVQQVRIFEVTVSGTFRAVATFTLSEVSRVLIACRSRIDEGNIIEIIA